MLQLRWMYQYPGLSPDLDLVVSQPVPTHIRSPFSQRLHQNPAFGGRGLRGTRPFFSSASKAMLHLRLVLPGSAGPDQVPEDSSTVICFPSGSFGRRTINQDPVHRVLPQGDEQLSGHCHDRCLFATAAVALDTLAEPDAECRAGLVSQPEPGQLDQCRSQARVSSLGYPFCSWATDPLCQGVGASPA